MALVSIIGRRISGDSTCNSLPSNASYKISQSVFQDISCYGSAGGIVVIQNPLSSLSIDDCTLFRCTYISRMNAISCPLFAKVSKAGLSRICGRECHGTYVQCLICSVSTPEVSIAHDCSIVFCGSQEFRGDFNSIEFEFGNFSVKGLNSSYNIESQLGAGVHIEQPFSGILRLSSFFEDFGNNIIWLHHIIDGFAFRDSNICNCSYRYGGLIGFRSAIYFSDSSFINNRNCSFKHFHEIGRGSLNFKDCFFSNLLPAAYNVVFYESTVTMSTNLRNVCLLNTFLCKAQYICIEATLFVSDGFLEPSQILSTLVDALFLTP